MSLSVSTITGNIWYSNGMPAAGTKIIVKKILDYSGNLISSFPTVYKTDRYGYFEIQAPSNSVVHISSTVWGMNESDEGTQFYVGTGSVYNLYSISSTATYPELIPFSNYDITQFSLTSHLHDANYLRLSATATQTVTGAVLFSSGVRSTPAPSGQFDCANKLYVDGTADTTYSNAVNQAASLDNTLQTALSGYVDSLSASIGRGYRTVSVTTNDTAQYAMYLDSVSALVNMFSVVHVFVNAYNTSTNTYFSKQHYAYFQNNGGISLLASTTVEGVNTSIFDSAITESDLRVDLTPDDSNPVIWNVSYIIL